jgi:hypothetical protein
MVPYKGGIFTFSAGKSEPGICLDIERLADELVPILRVDLPYLYQFGLIATGFMVQYDVYIHLHTGVMYGPDGIAVFLPGAIFCPDGIFLVELSQIIDVINVISNGIDPIGAFESRRKPDGGTPKFGQAGSFFFYFFP